MLDSVNSVIIDFDKTRSVPNEIPSEVEVSVVKMILITWDDCISNNFTKYSCKKLPLRILIKFTYSDMHIAVCSHTN